MKQTSIDWLIEKLMKGEFINNPDELIEQAKEMNKQEIIDAYCIGKYINVDDRQFGEQYYNKTFNQ